MTSKIAVLLVAFLLFAAGPIAVAQSTTSTLSGVIRDSSGAVIPGAMISVRNISTGATRETTTDEEGRYMA
jgi:hypothetical protein